MKGGSLSIRSLVTAAAVFVASLLALNFLAETLASYPSVPNSYDAPRNLYLRRAFPAFTEAPDPLPAGRTVIILSNSQGYMPEHTDAERSYASRLGALLNESKEEPWHVLNWSVPAGLGPEMTVLAARSGSHAPDIVVLVTFLSSFSENVYLQPLGFSINDVELLPAVPDVWRMLSPEFRKHFKTGGVNVWSDYYTGFGRFRWRTLETAYNAWGRAGVLMDFHASPCDIELPLYLVWGENSEWMLRDFAATVRRAAPSARLLVVQMPLASCGIEPGPWDMIAAAAARMEEVLADDPQTTVLNALDLVPSEGFHISTHMNHMGHELFAQWLFEAISHLDD